MAKIYDIEYQTASGEQHQLSEHKGKVLLIVNTASKCGLTPQFTGLEKLFQQFKDKDFSVLGFPCNQFANQDPGSDEGIQEFCQMNYGVSFPVYAKIDVNGRDAHPLFSHLSSAAPGLMGSQRIKWNFTKFLVDSEGTVVKRYAPTTKPQALQADIEGLLAQ